MNKNRTRPAKKRKQLPQSPPSENEQDQADTAEINPPEKEEDVADLPDNKSNSDLSDAHMDSPLSKAGSEKNPEQDGNKEEEEDNSLVVYHCWLCLSVEFIDKLSIIQHLKEWHKDRPEVQGLDRLMKVPVCMECGVQGPCEHQDGERPEEDDGTTAYACRPRFLVCSSCPEQFLNAEAVRTHRAEAHPDEPSHQCTYCPGVFVDHPSLVVHNRIHLGGRPYICSTCGNRFSKISDLKRHERIHSGEKPFKCMQCNQAFTQKSSLEKHAKIHARRSGHFACLQCGLLFKEKEALKEHAMAEHKGSNFQCGTCGKMYSEERYLLLHEKSHDADHLKPFPCNFCERRFSSQYMLNKHEKTSHISRREIKCHLCKKVFKRNENLTRHMLSHSGVKNFQCPECGVGFTEKGSLTRHFKAQHQQLRPHSCPICRRAFTRKALVRKHMQRFHVQKAHELVKERGKFFRCRLCLKLLRKSGKRQHERHHRSKGDTWDGSLEEELDDRGKEEEEGEGLEKVLGADVARLLSGKQAEGKEVEVPEEEEEEEDEDDEEDEAAEDKNEDDDELEDDEDVDEDEPSKGRNSFDEASKVTDDQEMERQVNQSGETRMVEEYREGPVFPEFSQVKVKADLPKSDAEEIRPELEEEFDRSEYREVGIVEKAQVRKVLPKNYNKVEARQEDQHEFESREAQNRGEDLALGQSSSTQRSDCRSPVENTFDNSSTGREVAGMEVHNARKRSHVSASQESVLRHQRMSAHRDLEDGQLVRPLADPHTMVEDHRLQQSYRDAREAQFTNPALSDSRRTTESGLNYAARPDDGVDAYSDTRRQGRRDPHYIDETMGLSRHVDQSNVGNPRYLHQTGIRNSGYQVAAEVAAVAAAQRLDQKSVADSQYRETSHRSREMEEESYRHQGISADSQERSQGAPEGRSYREAAFAYNTMDPRHSRNQASQESPNQAEVDDPRYREAAAAYAMMGIAGYPDPRMMGSGQQGQGYLGMYPWYSETALTHAMMGSRPPLQSMMGSLGYGGPGLMDSRLREQPGSLRDEQQYRNIAEMGSLGYRDDAYAQEQLMSPRHRSYEGMSDARYRGQGDLAASQYREQRSAGEARGYVSGATDSMASSGQRDDSNMDNRGYPGSSHTGSIHRSWI
ncbi:Zinc finger protein [Plakobranchus ocellatus]|uniref:Zinc finger protein n=1 Tax=Plakobranchus ocellatus TaxID=259542 RepID=A0AAV4CEY1_9GAST|nr:Zinc finger protein [Plakobranchus ocellatus]